MEGIKEEAEFVCVRIEALLAKGFRVVCNAVGQSRGGVACILLAQAIAEISRPDDVQLNILLFDPVPGPKWDPVNFKNVKAMTECSSLKRALALYPYEDLAMHTAILPVYPDGCEVEEDVVLGCHAGALMAPSRSDATCESFCRILSFMTECGTTFRKLSEVYGEYPSERDSLMNSRSNLLVHINASRWIYDCTGRERKIRRHKQGVFLNRWHEQLELKFIAERDAEQCYPGYECAAAEHKFVHANTFPRYMLAFKSEPEGESACRCS